MTSLFPLALQPHHVLYFLIPIWHIFPQSILHLTNVLQSHEPTTYAQEKPCPEWEKKMDLELTVPEQNDT